ncbi:DHH family phosphoesterase [Alicyclobacillus sp. ALC3]|uniref:DHH family phosphoesterase n=1 Tax=Alicyclobacillus sp. ALC3 TaxID=2796143 RepID=UPI0023792F08|nr:bifunctional oligoribonuclease/PAP phosphatase NrnA [Alicyclobacillus sp. ALC3]WDL99267.1 bifunctional oligoribonuclease/PAP phosphatase NrnA [Alicyclobacillus sp. ALC3]
MWEPAPRDRAGLDVVTGALQSADEWLIVTHENPDGDAIGSSLAIAHILEALGKQWAFLVSEPLPKRFDYLPMFERADVVTDPVTRRYSHIVAVDCADPARFRLVSDAFADGAQFVNIDHHKTNPHYGSAVWVDAAAAATCELIYHVACGLSVPLEVDLAKCLYTGILTDTGGFAYPSTTRDVHQIAAALLASGVRPYDIAEPALQSRTWEQVHLMQMALANLAVSADGQYSALYITRGMLDGAGAVDDDAEGLVEFARSIDTVEVGMLFRETVDGKVKVSLRSKFRVDVSHIAQSFGGGGHARAAGCVLPMDLDAAMDAVVQQVEVALAQA